MGLLKTAAGGHIQRSNISLFIAFFTLGLRNLSQRLFVKKYCPAN